MHKISQTELKQYFKQIKLLLPIYGKEEKVFINDLKKTVDAYVEEHPDCTYADILERFEEPAEVVYNYISSLDQHALCKRISLRKTIKRAIIIVVIAAVVAFAVKIVLDYQSYLKYLNTIVTHEKIIIE